MQGRRVQAGPRPSGRSPFRRTRWPTRSPRCPSPSEGVFLCWLLLRTGLIPRPLAILGLIGYPILAAGTIAELFGIHIGLLLTIPGGLFELALALLAPRQGVQPPGLRPGP